MDNAMHRTLRDCHRNRPCVRRLTTAAELAVCAEMLVEEERDWWVCPDGFPDGLLDPDTKECQEVLYDGEYVMACAF